MDKSNIFQQAISSMISELENTRIENWLKGKGTLQLYINFIDSLVDLPDRDPQKYAKVVIDEVIVDEVEEDEKDIDDGHISNFFSNYFNTHIENNNIDEVIPVSKEVIPVPIKSEPDKSRAYAMVRKLKGGFISEIQAYVPESVVRALDLKDGDLIIPHSQEEPGRYYYDLYEKCGRDLEGRIEHRYCLVEKEGSHFVIKQTLENGVSDLRYDETTFTFLIKDEDVFDHKLKEGDIVDIAYWKNNYKTMRIIWKHNIDDYEEETPLKAGHYKNKEKNQMAVPNNEINIFKNKNILVIGCEPRKRIYKEQIEARGGSFTFAEGTEGEDRLEQFIKKSDVTVLLTSFIRHQAFYSTVELCKKHDKTFSIVEGVGVKTVIQGAINPRSFRHMVS